MRSQLFAPVLAWFALFWMGNTALSQTQVQEESMQVSEEPFWLESATQAAQIAKETGKPILVYVRSENCHYCDLLQEKTWRDPKVRTMIARNMVPLKLTLEDNRQAVEAMKVRGYPSTLMFSAEREFLARIDGFVTPQEFKARIAKVQVAETPRLSSPAKR